MARSQNGFDLLNRITKILLGIAIIELPVGIIAQFYPHGLYIGPLEQNTDYFVARCICLIIPLALIFHTLHLRKLIGFLGKGEETAEVLSRLNRVRRDGIVTFRFAVLLFIPLLALFTYTVTNRATAIYAFGIAVLFYIAYEIPQIVLHRTIQKIQSGELDAPVCSTQPIERTIRATRENLDDLKQEAIWIRTVARGVMGVMVIAYFVTRSLSSTAINWFGAVAVHYYAKEIDNATQAIGADDGKSIGEQLDHLVRVRNEIISNYRTTMIVFVGVQVIGFAGFGIDLLEIISTVILIAMFVGFEFAQKKYQRKLDAIVSPT